MKEAYCKMNKKKLKQQLRALDEGILNGTINIPDNAIVSLPESTSIFTKKRLELIEVIKICRPRSVLELAKITKRAKQAVTRDLKLLERFEIVRLEKRGRESRPMVEREVVVMTIPYSNPVLLERTIAVEKVL